MCTRLSIFYIRIYWRKHLFGYGSTGKDKHRVGIFFIWLIKELRVCLSVPLGVDRTTKWLTLIYRFTKWESCVYCSLKKKRREGAIKRFAVKVDRKSSKSAEYEKGTDAEFSLTLNFSNQPIINTKDLLYEKFNSFLILPKQWPCLSIPYFIKCCKIQQSKYGNIINQYET